MKALAALLCVAAGPAAALSCLRPDVASSYQHAADAEEDYVVLHGMLTHDDPKVPESDLSDQTPEEIRFPARIVGKALTKKGFTVPFAVDVTVELGCAGPWCAGLPSQGDVLAFVQTAGDGDYLLRLGPCGGEAFANPTEEMVKRVEVCHQGGACERAEP